MIFLLLEDQPPFTGTIKKQVFEKKKKNERPSLIHPFVKKKKKIQKNCSNSVLQLKISSLKIFETGVCFYLSFLFYFLILISFHIKFEQQTKNRQEISQMALLRLIFLV